MPVAAITQPSLFVGGALDASAGWIQNVIDGFSSTMPGNTRLRSAKL
jgi:hypothetical protein